MMVTVNEARKLIPAHIPVAATAWIPVHEALGRYAADDICSPHEIPGFDQSAVDGYAFAFTDSGDIFELILSGEVAAGTVASEPLSAGNCVRIFTGAQLPVGADTVVMQEHVFVEDNCIKFASSGLFQGANVRPAGSHIRKDEKIIPAGTRLNAASLGLLCSAGVSYITCVPEPSITLIITGNELVMPGSAPVEGKIFESNSCMLLSLLAEQGYSNVNYIFVRDNFDEISRQFLYACRNSDFIIFSGGISVGDYDFVSDVLKLHEVRTAFYKVKQKPGKPVFMGVKDSKVIFALPGNPASVWVCFFEYVVPALRKYSGATDLFQNQLVLPVMNSYTKKEGMVHFLKAFTDFQSVQILEGQESYKLKSASMANCLVELPETCTSVVPGDKVIVQLTSVIH